LDKKIGLNMKYCKVKHNSNVNLFSYENLNINIYDRVAVRTTNCIEAGIVSEFVKDEKPKVELLELFKKNNDNNLNKMELNEKNINNYFFIERKFTEKDFELELANREKERDVFIKTNQIINKLKLPMFLVNTHIYFDESKYLFNFIAEKRIDFRNLIHELVGLFRVRIELRQIGTRDRSGIVGGVGTCAKKLCCSGINFNINSISVKMAKDQHISINTSKISGVCGRLKCCLKFEHSCYMDEYKKYPKIDSILHYNDKKYHVIDVNIQTQNVKLRDKEGNIISVPKKELNVN